MPKIQLSKPQLNFIQSQSKGTLFCSGLGTGKSFILVLKSILLALDGKRGLFLSYSLNNIRDNILVLFRELLQLLGYSEGVEYSITKSPAINIVIKGTEVMLRTASEPNLLRGPSVSFLVLEEARELTREAFDVGLGRLRKGEDLQWFIASTTKGKDWMWQIVDGEGLAGVFDSDIGLLKNDHITVIRTTTEESPHLSNSYVEELKRQYTSSFMEQELNARIIDATNGLFKTEWFKQVQAVKPIKGVRSWDLATSTKTSADYSVGLLISKPGNYIVHDVIRVKQMYPDLKETIIKTACDDGPGITIGLEDAGQQLAVIQDLRRDPRLCNFVIKTYKPTKDKYSRALPIASQSELGHIDINISSWNRVFFDELTSFTGTQTTHDDVLDALSQGYYLLNTGGPTIVMGLH